MDIVITSLELPGIDGNKLTAFLSKEYPGTKIIVMTSTKSKIAIAKIKELGGVVFPDDKIDFSALTKKVFTELQIDTDDKTKRVYLPSFLQMIELEGKSCNLLIFSGINKGFLYFLNGKLIAARTNEETGKAAAVEIIGWDEVLIEIDYSHCPVKKELDVPLTSILLESQEIRDEKQHEGNQKRKYERFKCLVAIDYDMDDWAYQSNVKNISAGGAFIEVDHPATIGEKIVLTLSTASPPKTCDISGTIMRRNRKGIGIKFDNLSIPQREMLDMIINKKEK